MKLKRKFFGTDGIRARVGSPTLKPDFLQKLGVALGVVIKAGYQFVLEVADFAAPKIIIARDTRESGEMLQAALSAGLASVGVDVIDVGILPTPACAYLVQALQAQGGVVISASHNPYYDNGVKFFSAGGNKLNDEQESRIEQLLDELLNNKQGVTNITVDAALYNTGSKVGKIINDATLSNLYVKHCFATLNSDHSDLDQIKKFKIVIDCANGAMYQVAPQVFQQLGMDAVFINYDPNGVNINYESGAACSIGLQKLAYNVQQNNADLGIAFDGDGDRVILVGPNGDIIDGDQILYILACHQFDNQFGANRSYGVVGTQMSNLGLEQALLKKGFSFERTQVGDRYVLEKLLEKNWTLGGETSGHILNFDRSQYCDGLIISLLIIAVMVKSKKSIYELVEGFYKYPQVMVNIDISNRKTTGHDILSNEIIKSAIADIETSFANGTQGIGRLLIRESGTEPLIRVMVEGEKLDHIEKTAKELANVIRSQI